MMIDGDNNDDDEGEETLLQSEGCEHVETHWQRKQTQMLMNVMLKMMETTGGDCMMVGLSMVKVGKR